MRTRIVIVLIAMFTAVPGCVRLGPPLTPDELTAETMSHLTLEQQAAIRSAPNVCFRMPGWQVGSGTMVAPDRMVISDHQVKDQMSPITFLMVDYECSLITRGNFNASEFDCEMDWAVLALDPPCTEFDDRFLEVDTERPLATGDEIYFAGNWTGHLPDKDAVLRFGPTYARLVVSPEQRDPRVLQCTLPSQEHLILLNGFSGSPALVWDDERDAFVVIGICVGYDWPWYVVCRFPMRLLTEEAGG